MYVCVYVCVFVSVKNKKFLMNKEIQEEISYLLLNLLGSHAVQLVNQTCAELDIFTRTCVIHSYTCFHLCGLYLYA